MPPNGFEYLNSEPSSSLIVEPSPPLFELVGGWWTGLSLGSVPLFELPPVTVLFLGLITTKYTGTMTAVATNARATTARAQMRGFLWRGVDFLAERVPGSSRSFSATPGSSGAEFAAELFVRYESRGVGVPSEGARYRPAGGRRGSLKTG